MCKIRYKANGNSKCRQLVLVSDNVVTEEDQLTQLGRTGWPKKTGPLCYIASNFRNTA